MYQLKLTEGAARRGALTTVHGTVQTPAFMNRQKCWASRRSTAFSPSPCIT